MIQLPSQAPQTVRPPGTPHLAPPAAAPETTRERWAAAWSAPGFRVELLATALGAALGLKLFSAFLAWVETREGAQLTDPFLALFRSRDVGEATFAVIYGGILFALVALRRHPERLVRMVQAYLVLITVRALVMSVTPLAPPEHLIVLRDPIVNTLIDGPPLQRDLFFSGHTSTLTLLCLCAPGPRTRWTLAVAALVCAALLLAQHAHYTVDVLVAPLAAWAAYSLVFLTRRSARATRL